MIKDYMQTNIGIIGVGGVGGYFGGKLCKLSSDGGGNVYFVARGRHLDEIRKHGLLLSTTEGNLVCKPTLTTDNFDDLPMLDVCLLCVKSYDLPDALRQLRRKVSRKTLIVPLLNGIDIYERVRETIDTAKVFPSCVYIATRIEMYGKVTQQGGPCKIMMGRDPRAPAFVPQQLFDIFTRSGIKHQWYDDIYPEIWSKYIFIAAFGLTMACFDKTLGQVMESEDLSGYVTSVMQEIVALSRKQGIALPETVADDEYRKAKSYLYDTKVSFQRDFERYDKPDERDLYGGTIIRLGKSLGVPTPVTQELYKKLNQKKPLPTHQ